jgi:hypothetical protein
MSTFETKKVWFSKFKYASPLVIKFTSGPTQSKFKKDELIAFFEVQGDETKYNLVLENADIRAQVEATPKNQWLNVSAEGNSAEEQTLVINGSSTAAVPAVANVASNSAAPAAVSGGGTAGRYGPDNISGCMTEIMNTASHLFGIDHFLDKDGTVSLTEQGRWAMSLIADKWFSTGRFMPLYDGQLLESDYAVLVEPTILAKIEALDEWVRQIKWKGTSHDDKQLASVKKGVLALCAAESPDEEKVDRAIAWCLEEFDYQNSAKDIDEDDIPF